MPGELQTRIQEQMKQALRNRQSDRLAVLRMLLNEIKSAEIYHQSTDELAAVRGYHKKLTKARTDYEKANAPTHLAKLDAEIAIVAEFLPAAMPDDELERVVEQIIRDQGFSSPKDFGRAMKEILAQCGDRAEGSRVAAILKAKLAGHA